MRERGGRGEHVPVHAPVDCCPIERDGGADAVSGVIREPEGYERKRGDMGNKRVLIVDDEPDVVESIRFRLGIENIECLEAGDGAEGLRIAREALPDLIILDVMMPRMTGYKVARSLKQDERYRHIPVILLTARSQAGDRMLGVDSGANDYVTKPFDLDELTAKVLKYLTFT